jgi:hypothetical protein
MVRSIFPPHSGIGLSGSTSAIVVDNGTASTEAPRVIVVESGIVILRSAYDKTVETARRQGYAARRGQHDVKASRRFISHRGGATTP